ncbi:MAG: SCO family protein [Gammaproteobacteria bacterium]|nr:SCO family protein [Gammaproteobacteria bacterium]
MPNKSFANGHTHPESGRRFRRWRSRFCFCVRRSARDSLAEIGSYARNFDPSIRGVTGSEEQLSKLASSLGIRFEVSPSDNYTVAHSIAFSIIDPQGAFRGRFRPGFDAPALVRDLASRFERRPVRLE